MISSPARAPLPAPQASGPSIDIAAAPPVALNQAAGRVAEPQREPTKVLCGMIAGFIAGCGLSSAHLRHAAPREDRDAKKRTSPPRSAKPGDGRVRARHPNVPLLGQTIRRRQWGSHPLWPSQRRVRPRVDSRERARNTANDLKAVNNFEAPVGHAAGATGSGGDQRVQHGAWAAAPDLCPRPVWINGIFNIIYYLGLLLGHASLSAELRTAGTTRQHGPTSHVDYQLPLLIGTQEWVVSPIPRRPSVP